MAAVRGKLENSYLMHKIPTELLSVVRKSYPRLSNKEVDAYIVNYSD